MKHRFEFVEGTSNKFWEVVVSNNQVSVTFGRIGTTGQTQTTPFADLAAATKHANKQIEQKLAKGYIEQRLAA